MFYVIIVIVVISIFALDVNTNKTCKNAVYRTFC